MAGGGDCFSKRQAEAEFKLGRHAASHSHLLSHLQRHPDCEEGCLKQLIICLFKAKGALHDHGRAERSFQRSLVAPVRLEKVATGAEPWQRVPESSTRRHGGARLVVERPLSSVLKKKVENRKKMTPGLLRFVFTNGKPSTMFPKSSQVGPIVSSFQRRQRS